jgi:hypothetical protein
MIDLVIMSGAADSSRPMVPFGRSGSENLCLQPKCPIHFDVMNRTILALSCLHPYWGVQKKNASLFKHLTQNSLAGSFRKIQLSDNQWPAFSDTL